MIDSRSNYELLILLPYVVLLVMISTRLRLINWGDGLTPSVMFLLVRTNPTWC
jgi:hypothetical protein